MAGVAQMVHSATRRMGATMTFIRTVIDIVTSTLAALGFAISPPAYARVPVRCRVSQPARIRR
jgi:hypothetical protein